MSESLPPPLDQIGNTPLSRLPIDGPARLLGKLESLNPGGSIKDRTALFMVRAAERSGELLPGGVIVEASSGNQGIALAMIGAARGYKAIITVPGHTSEEKVRTLRAYGAEVHVCPSGIPVDDPASYVSKARAIAKRTPGSYMPDQYFNRYNPLAHYSETGPEIWRQTEGCLTHFFCAMGSCGSISGIGRFLKERCPEIRIVGVDSACSLLSGTRPGVSEVDGIGVDVISDTLDRAVIDEIVPVGDERAFGAMRRFARRGLLVGPSSGAVLSVVEERSRTLVHDAVAVCLLADSGRAYLSKLGCGVESAEIANEARTAIAAGG